MKLIPNWRKALRLFSVQANAIGSSISVGYVAMYDKLKDNFSPKYMVAITAAVFIIGIIGRVLSQEKK